jgi:hypothetical protein
MSSRAHIPIDLNRFTFEPSLAPLGLTLPNAFNQIIRGEAPTLNAVKRDRCTRPTVIYNSNYNLYKPVPKELSADYSPYDFGEPLFDDRTVY